MCGQWGQTGAYFSYDHSRRKSQLDLEVIDRILDELTPRGLKLIDMEGGETLLYPKLEDLLDRMRRRGLYVKFATNGTLLNRFATDIVASGVKSVTVSIDGDKETHNSIRGRSWAYDRALKGLLALSEMKKKLAKNNPLVQIAFTVSRHNGAEALRRFCEDLKGKGLADVLEIKLTPIFVPEYAEHAYMGLIKDYFGVDKGILSPGGFREDYSDFEEEGQLIAKVLFELERGDFDFMIEPLPHISFKQIPRLYSHYGWDLGRSPCAVPYDEPTVDADGNVYPCNLFTDAPISMGNVYEKPFLEIWSGPNFMTFRKMIRDRGGLLPICNRCCQLTEY